MSYRWRCGSLNGDRRCAGLSDDVSLNSNFGVGDGVIDCSKLGMGVY